jgi:hypothetical protein
MSKVFAFLKDESGATAIERPDRRRHFGRDHCGRKVNGIESHNHVREHRWRDEGCHWRQR